MKCLVLSAWCLTLGASCAIADDADLPRNPFWPQGYEGTRHPITLEPRFKPEPPKPEGETNKVDAVAKPPRRLTTEELARKAKIEEEELQERLWSEAVKTLRFGSVFGFSSAAGAQASVLINDRAYAVGDLVSADYRENRFTWRVERLSTAGKLQLKRLNYSPIRKNP